MTLKRLIFLILLVALVPCVYYLLPSPQLLQSIFLVSHKTDYESSNLTSKQQTTNDFDNNRSAESKNTNPGNNGASQFSVDPEAGKGSSGQNRHLEISGIVVDKHRRPIDNALISEEQYFFSTRTDSYGRYKIFVDLPQHKFPVLHFLRSGFQDKNIELDAHLFNDMSAIKLDVTLIDDADFISAKGWIGNDIGAGLGGLKIQLNANNLGLDKIYQTVFSDVDGYFVFEGVKAGDIYRLTAFSTPEYLSYVDEKFTITKNTPQLNIILDSVKLLNIDGMIINSKSVPIPDFEIYIRNISTGIHFEKIVSDSSGFFSLKNFPAGEVKMTTQGPDYFKITGLTLKPDEYRNLNLIVDKGGHYLSGWVSDENAIPVARASVTLGTKYQIGSVEYTSLRIKSTDNAGVFNFDNLGSGVHTLSINAFGFHKYEILHHFESQTDELHIALSRR